MKKNLLYFIVDDNGRSYSNDSDGNLITTPSLQPLDNSPDGWQDTAIKYGRNENYYGIIRSISVPLGFRKLGARIIRQLYYGVKGIQAAATLVMAKYNPIRMRYERLYSAAINFATISDQEDQAEISTTDGDLSAMIAANEGTTYEIPVDVAEALNVTMDPITLYSVVKTTNYAYTLDLFTDNHIFLGMVVSDTETKYASLIWNDTTNYYQSQGSFSYQADQWLFKTMKAAQVRIQSSSFKMEIAGAGSYRIVLFITDQVGGDQELDIIPTTSIPGTPQNLDVSFDVTFDLPANQYAYLVVQTGLNGAGYVAAFSQADNAITITYDYNHDSTVVQWVRPMYLFQQLISKISNGKYSASSVYLSTEAANYVVGCGDSIRGFRSGTTVGYEGPKIKTSLRDFFQSFNTIYPIGLSIENNVAVLEKRERFYNSSVVVADLGDVRDCRPTCAAEYIPSSIEIGWPNQTYDDVNGREEFNTTHVYTTPITRQSQKMDLVAKYRADCYGIEFTRVNFDAKTTTDSDSDGDVFILNITQTPEGQLIINRPPGSIVSGVLGGLTTFNWLLSPKRCLLNHGAWIHGGLDKQDDGVLTFSSSAKNQLFASTIFGESVVEKANVPVASLPDKLFLPHIFEFTCQTAFNIVDLIETTPFGVIQFSWFGNSYKGFILDAGQQPALNPEQTFKLLAAPGNNMLNLIR